MHFFEIKKYTLENSWKILRKKELQSSKYNYLKAVLVVLEQSLLDLIHGNDSKAE